MKRSTGFFAITFTALIFACFHSDPMDPKDVGPENPVHWSGDLYRVCDSGRLTWVIRLNGDTSSPLDSVGYILYAGASLDSIHVGASFSQDSLTVRIDSLDAGFVHGSFELRRAASSGEDTLRGRFTLVKDIEAPMCPAVFSCVESFPLIQLTGEWTWRSSQLGSPTRRLSAVIWTGERLVAAGEGGKLHVSPDGVEWTQVASGTTRYLLALACGRSGVIAVGDSGTILKSINGLEWTAESSGTTNTLYAAAWAGNQFVVVGSGGTILTSADGSLWTRRSTDSATSSLNALAVSPNLILAAGNGGDILTSPNGTVWTRRKVSGFPLNSVAWTGLDYAAYVAGDYSTNRWGYSYYSQDAVSWQRESYVPQQQRPYFWKLFRFGEQLAGITKIPPDMVTMEVIRYSADNGASWTSDTVPGLRGIRELAWTGSRMVAVGWDGIVTKP